MRGSALPTIHEGSREGKTSSASTPKPPKKTKTKIEVYPKPQKTSKPQTIVNQESKHNNSKKIVTNNGSYTQIAKSKNQNTNLNTNQKPRSKKQVTITQPPSLKDQINSLKQITRILDDYSNIVRARMKL